MPFLTSLRFTHSPNTYDRAPIIVSPNSGCLELPKRGARKLHSPPADFDSDDERRGRSLSREPSRERDDLSESPQGDVKGSYFHPRAYEACTLEPSDLSRASSIALKIPSQPLLVADLSPSDESDDSIATPPDHANLGPALLTSSSSRPRTLHPAHRQLNKGCYDAQGSPSHSAYASTASPNETQRCRPHLERSSARRLDKPSRPFRANLDEGCLGGF